MREWYFILHGWHEFYAFAGAAAATLLGLMFVVMTLNQSALMTEAGSRVLRAFFTPTVAFFTTIIVIAMVMLIPETSPSALAGMLGAVAVVGVLYMVASGVHRMWRANDLGLDDLLWYVILPYVGYAAFGAAAVGVWIAGAGVWTVLPISLYAAATAVFLLLLAGIRNAWDLVVYNIQRRGGGSQG